MLLEPEPLALDLEPAPGERTEPTLGSNLDLEIDDEPPVHRAPEIDEQPAFSEPLGASDDEIPEKA